MQALRDADGPVEVDVTRGVASRSGQRLALSAKEVAVLAVLGAAGGRVVGRSELQRRAGLGNRTPRRCDAMLVGLRRALGAESIATVRSRGWRCLLEVGPVGPEALEEPAPA